MSDQYDIDSVDNQRRRDLGLQVLSRIDGDAGQSVIESLSTSNPALGHHIAAFAFGDIYDRPGLDARSRQLVTIGVLTTLGGCEPQLKVHVGAALNVDFRRGNSGSYPARLSVLRLSTSTERYFRSTGSNRLTAELRQVS